MVDKRCANSTGNSEAGRRRPRISRLLKNKNTIVTHIFLAECNVCISAAYYMNKINYSVNPCDNFFDFACGKWNSQSKIPPWRSHYNTYAVVRDRLMNEMAGMMSGQSCIYKEKPKAWPMPEYGRITTSGV